LVPDHEWKWKIVLKRIQIAEIPDKTMNTGGFWAKILVSDREWKIVLKRIRIAGILDKAMNTDGF
jgi:hypothetical protein